MKTETLSRDTFRTSNQARFTCITRRRGTSPALSGDPSAHCAGLFPSSKFTVQSSKSAEAGFVLRVPLIIVLCGCVAWAASIVYAARIALPVPAGLRAWFQFKRVCAWCKPMRYLGGNPFAKQVTHGMCSKCFCKMARELELEKQSERGVKSSILSNWLSLDSEAKLRNP